MLAECPGWPPGVGALGARPTRRAPGRGSLGSATRDTWRVREHPGNSPGWVLGNTCRDRRLPGKISLAGLAALSGLPGGSITHSALGFFRGKYHSLRIRSLPVTRGAFAGFRDSITRWASRCTRELPGGLRLRHSGTGGTLRRWVRKGVSRWHVPKEAFGLASGTRVILRRFPTDVSTELRRTSGRASGRLRRVYRSGASGIRVILRKALKGSFGVARPEGVFEGVLPRGCFGEFPGGSSG